MGCIKKGTMASCYDNKASIYPKKKNEGTIGAKTPRDPKNVDACAYVCTEIGTIARSGLIYKMIRYPV